MFLYRIIELIITIILIVIYIIYKKHEKNTYKKEKSGDDTIYTFNNHYGYVNHPKINIDDISSHQELPKNNIYYNAALIWLNEFDYNANNLFGAIILQWAKDKRIAINEKNEIYLDKLQSFSNKYEEKLFEKLQEASHDNVLEEAELKKWVKNNFYAFYDTLMFLKNDEIRKLNEADRIKRINGTYVMDEGIYNDSVKLLGLKKYLINFSDMNLKEIKELSLWEDYLIYANLFGIADKVNEQLEKHYPNPSEYTAVDTFFIVLGAILESYIDYQRNNY